MTDLILKLLDFIGALSPVRIVWHWQKALIYWCGRYQYTTGPGLKLIVPGLMDVKQVSVATEISYTSLQSITLRGDDKHDPGCCSYTCSITWHVFDPEPAGFGTLGH